MIAAIADPAFWYGLALKIAMTASIVVAASVVVERRAFIGSLIAALPTAGGAAMIILALEHSAQLISHDEVRKGRACIWIPGPALTRRPGMTGHRKAPATPPAPAPAP